MEDGRPVQAPSPAALLTEMQACCSRAALDHALPRDLYARKLAIKSVGLSAANRLGRTTGPHMVFWGAMKGQSAYVGNMI
jgi:hypothetical protein